MELCRITEGSIAASRLTESIPHNKFLCTTQVDDDFELRWLEAPRSFGRDGDRIPVWEVFAQWNINESASTPTGESGLVEGDWVTCVLCGMGGS